MRNTFLATITNRDNTKALRAELKSNDFRWNPHLKAWQIIAQTEHQRGWLNHFAKTTEGIDFEIIEHAELIRRINA